MIKIIFFLFPILLYGGTDLYREGKKLYFSKGCSGCHGVSASGTSQYPPLAYRRKPFLAHKLKEYRAKRGMTQQSQMMIPFAMGLNDSEIDALATFLSGYNENKSTYQPEFSVRGDGGS